jgi:general stress protein 26
MDIPPSGCQSQDDLVTQALAVIHSDRLPYLATVEHDQPRLRPIAPVKTEGFTVYVVNLRSYGKTSQIEANPRVELCYLDGHHDQVRITGIAEVVTDPAIRDEVWGANPQLQRFFQDSGHTDFILYRIVPKRVRFMKEWALTYREVPFQQRAEDEESR